MSKFDDAIEIYSKYGEDFTDALAWHLAYGVVVSLPDCLMLAYFCDRSDVRQCLDVTQSDCVFVTMCIGDMRQAGKQIVELVPYIAYERELKGDNRIRIKDFRKFYNKL